MTTASIDGTTIGYDDEGAGAPLVLIHGHPFDRSMCAPQVTEFTGSGWRVIAPDLGGYGESSVTPGTIDWSTFARDTAAVLDHLQLDDGTKARHAQADRLLRAGMRGCAEEVLATMVAPYNITALPAVAAHVLAMMLRQRWQSSTVQPTCRIWSSPRNSTERRTSSWHWEASSCKDQRSVRWKRA